MLGIDRGSPPPNGGLFLGRGTSDPSQALPSALKVRCAPFPPVDGYVQRAAPHFGSYAVLRALESFVLYVASWALPVGLVIGGYYLLF